MKKCLLILQLLLCIAKINAQHNLVPNPSFEQYTVCPNNFTDPPPTYWYEPTNYINNYSNSCSNSIYYGVPYSFAVPDYQYARTGNGYVGIFLSRGIGLESRDYFQVKLQDSLRKGKSYYTEFYVAFLLCCNL